MACLRRQFVGPVFSPLGLPTTMAPRMFLPAVLDGRLAVACNLQSAIAGLNSPTRQKAGGNLWWNVLKRWLSGDENGQTPSGSEGSSGKLCFFGCRKSPEWSVKPEPLLPADYRPGVHGTF